MLDFGGRGWYNTGIVKVDPQGQIEREVKNGKGKNGLGKNGKRYCPA